MELVNNITFLSIILAGAALIREREHGTLEHLLVMPLTPFQIMAAKVWANGLVVLAVAAASLGILLATIARSMPQFALLMILVVVPLQMLSGSNTSPTESMPLAVQTVMLASPTTYFVSLAQAVLFRGAGVSVVWPQLMANLLIGAIFFLAALTRFRRTVTLA
jgi:ABC-2 type transport system permease protein